MNVEWKKYRIPITPYVDRLLQPEYISELIGTFFLVFTVGVNVLQGKTLAPLSIGGILMCFIFATGWYVDTFFGNQFYFSVYLVHTSIQQLHWRFICCIQ